MISKVQNKIIVIMSAMTVIMLTGIYLLKLSDHKKILMLIANQRVEKQNLLTSVLEIKSKVIENFVYDYTYWDEMVRFVKTGDPAWGRDNLEASIPSFDVDIVWVLNTDLNVVYSTNRIQENSYIPLPLSKEDLNSIISGKHFYHFHIKTDIGLIEVFGASIHPTDDEERVTPAQGYFFAGRLMSEQYFNEISEITGMHVFYKSSDKNIPSNSDQDLKEFSLTCSQNIYTWDGASLDSIRSTTQAVIAGAFKKRSDQQFRMNILYSTLFMAILFFLLLRYINKPLILLEQSLSIGDAHLLQGMLKQKNEFGKLAVMIKESFEHKDRLVEDIDARKLAEEELRKSEEKYRNIFENAQDVYFEISLEGEILELSPSITDFSMGQYQREELIGRSMFDFYADPDERGQIIKALQETGGLSKTEVKLKNRDGSIVVSAAAMKLICDNQGTPQKIIGSMHDITERKTMEEQLLVKNFAVESSVNAIVFASLEGILFYANQSFLHMWGYTLIDEVIGKPVHEFADSPQRVNASKEALKEGKEYVAEQVGKRKDGTRFHMQMTANLVKNPEGMPVCTMASFIDITDRKKAEEQLLIKNFAVESSVSAIAFTDLRGMLFYANQSYLNMWGYTNMNEVVGKHIYEFADSPQSVDASVDAMQEGKEYVAEQVGKRKDGTRFHMQMTANLVKNPEGVPICTMASFIDITDRKKAEEQLIIKNFAVESSVSAIGLADLKWNVIYVNKAFMDMWGYEHIEEILGKPINMFAESENSVEQAFKAIHADQPYVKEEVGRRKNGTLIYVQMSANIVRNEGGEPICIMASFIDITDRKKAEEQLIIKNFAVESSVSAIGLADLQGKLFYGNQAYMEMWGFNHPEEMIGKGISDYEFDQENTRKVMAALQSGKGFVGEMRATKRDGTPFDIQMSANLVFSYEGEPVCLMASFLDVTDRKKVTAVLRESEERYRTMITNSSDLIQSVSPDGQFLYVNPNWCQIMGYSEDEAKDLNLFDLIHPDSFSHCRSLFKKVFHGNSIPFIETTFIAKNGKQIFLEGNVSPRIIDGKIIATQSFFHDVTDRKEGQEALSITNQRLNLLQKITEFLHESLDPEVIFNRITDAIVKSMGFSTAIVILSDEHHEQFMAKSLTSSKNYLTKINKVLGFPLHKLSFPISDTIESLKHPDTADKIIVGKHLSDITHPPLSIATCNALEKIGGNKSYILIPLIRDGVLIGGIVVTSNKEEIPKEDIEMLDTFALTAVQAIVNADLLEKTNKAKEQIQRSLKEKEILLRELFHRTKNNMQVISSMLRIRSRTIQDPEVTSIFNDLDSKILSMAMAHQKLYDSEDLSHLDLKEYFQTLIRLFMSTYNIISSHVTFSVSGDNVKVMIDTAIPSGLIVNELVSNSLKHAFPDKRKGNIDVKLHISKKKDLIVEVSDNGVGFPRHFNLERDSNLGLKTAIDLVEYQLQGKIDLIRKKGTLWRITLGEELYCPRV